MSKLGEYYERLSRSLPEKQMMSADSVTDWVYLGIALGGITLDYLRIQLQQLISPAPPAPHTLELSFPIEKPE